MTRLKLATLCLLLAIAALLLAGVPNQASAQGICQQLNKNNSKVKKQGCVTGKDVANNSLTGEDLKYEAGVNFAKGEVAFRNIPKEKKVYLRVAIKAPKKGLGQIVVNAYVQMTTFVPQQIGGALACNIEIDGRLRDEPAPAEPAKNLKPNQVVGSVSRGEKWVETMLWSETFQVSGGRSKFELVCQRLDAPEETFSFSSFMVAEYYPMRY